MTKLNMLACAAILAAGGAFADAYVWSAGSSDGKMNDSGNWQAGAAPTADLIAEATAPDIDLGAGDPHAKVPVVSMGDAASFNQNLWIGALSGSKYRIFKFCPGVNSFYSATQYLSVADPSGFHGWWRGKTPDATGFYGPARPGILVTAADPAKAVLHRVETDGRTRIMATGTLTVEETRGFGTFEVNASDVSGTVVFLEGAGPRANPVVRNGTLRVVGSAPDNASAPTAGAWAHFDASDASTLSVSGTDISEWRDKSGLGPSATSTHAYNTQGGAAYFPQLVEIGGKGMKAVNFGAFGIGASGSLRTVPEDLLAKYGRPTAMVVGDGNRLVREIFFVARENGEQDGICYPSVGGPDFSAASGQLAGWTNRIARARDASRLFRDTLPELYCIENADIRVDGQRVRPDFTCDFSKRMHVISISLPDGLTTGIQNLSLSRDSTGSCSFGGFVLGEVMFYTNTLTAAERRRNNDYLMKKWLEDDAAANWDFGRVTLAFASARFEAASGTVKVRELELPSGTASFAKTGAGKLVVERLLVDGVATNLPVSVEEGEFAFADSFSAVTKAKAPDPDCWFDATQISAGDILHSNSVDYVTIWRDPRVANFRGDTNTLERMRLSSNRKDERPAYPTLVDNAVNGRPAVDLGEFCDSYASAGWDWASTGRDSTALALRRNGKCAADRNEYSNDAKSKSIEAFLVIKFKDVRASHFSGSIQGNMAFFKYGENTNLYRPRFCACPDVDAAEWFVNGRKVDGSLSGTVAAGNWYVINFAAENGAPADALGIDRGQYSHGGIQVAEMITYDRHLTAGERRNTVAYLMDKWLGEELPDAAFSRSVSTWMMPSGANPSIAADGDLAIGELAAADSTEIGGMFTKTGSGNVSIGNVFTGKSFTGFNVEGGSLSVGLSLTPVLGRAFFHLDASKRSSMTITNDVPGGTDFVTVWADVRNNGRVAEAVTGGKFKPGVSPRLKAFTVNGREIKAMDYGPATRDAGADGFYATGDLTAGHNWYTTSTDDRNQTYAELYIVSKSQGFYPETGSGSRTRYFDNCTGNLSGFFRNSDSKGKIVHTGVQTDLYNGKIWLDGVEYDTAALISPADAVDDTEHFHVTAFRPLSATPNVHAFGNRAKADAGGEAVAESIVFAAANSDPDASALREYLYSKWLGDGSATYGLSLDSIFVANGATLTLDADGGYVGAISVTSLGGDGAVDTSAKLVCTSLFDIGDAPGRTGSLAVGGDISLAGVTAFTLDVESGESFDSLSAGGMLALPAACTLTVNTPPRMRGSALEVFRAESISGSVSGWTVRAPSLKVGGVPRLEVSGGAVLLRFFSPGTYVIVR